MQVKWFVAAGVVALIAGITYAKLADQDRASVRILDREFEVLVADSFFEQRQGLSDVKLDELDADGMLFTFDGQDVRNFWMKDMEFALDVLWIKEGKIVDMDLGVPAPERGEEPRKMSSNPIGVDMALELPAGDVAKYGILAGMSVEVLP